MNKRIDIRELYGQKRTEIRSLIETAEGAGRDLAGEEQTRYDALKDEAEALEKRMARAEAVAEMERRAEAAPVNGDLARETRAYSIAKGVQEFSTGRLTGHEAEIQQELSRGREARGLLVPTEILLRETRSQSVDPNPAGGYLVATQLAALADRFRPSLKTEAMGATILRGLTGFLDLPNLASSGSAS